MLTYAAREYTKRGRNEAVSPSSRNGGRRIVPPVAGSDNIPPSLKSISARMSANLLTQRTTTKCYTVELGMG